MTNTPTRIPYAKDLTPIDTLTQKNLEHLAQLERQVLEASREMAATREPTVQMSIRVREDAYFRFRALCKVLHKTHRDMVVLLLEAFLKEGRVDHSRGGR